MKLVYFNTREEAERAGIQFNKANFKKFGVIVIYHKKKVMSVLLEKSKWGIVKRNRPKDVVMLINAAVRELSRVYPELRR